MTVRWITRRIAQAESKWRKKGKFRGHSHVDAVACVGGWRAEPNVAPGVGQCQGGEQTGAPAALRPLQAHQSQEEPEFHPVVRAAGKQQHTKQLPNEFVILVLLCPLVRLPISLSFDFFSFFLSFFSGPFFSSFVFFSSSLFFLLLLLLDCSLFIDIFFSVAWLWVIPSFRSSFSRVCILRYGLIFFFFLKRVESRFTAGFGYVTLSVYKGK